MLFPIGVVAERTGLSVKTIRFYSDHLTHEEILGRSQFCRVDRRAYEFERVWTVEQAIGYLYSTSLPLRRALGEQRPAFEHAVREELLTLDPSGRFVEPVTLEVLTATRP